MKVNADELSQPISDDQVCGEDLEYDAAFQAMETALESREEQEMGDATLEAAGPDWATVSENAAELLERTRDMRVFVYLAMAGLHQDGLPAFHQSLLALNNCMENYWDELHPLLDPDDDNDPMMRMNVLQNLDDYEKVRLGIRKSPLVSMQGLGSFSLWDIDLATGARSAGDEEEVLDLAIIRGAFADGDQEQLTAVSDAVQGALDELARMSELWSDKTDGYEQPGLDNAVDALREVQRTLQEYAPAGSVAAADDAAPAEQGGGEAVASAPGVISTPADVVQAIDRICEYYERNEPSSPIPVILRRAQRLVSKDFYEILQDLAPDGVTQFEQISGQSTEDEY